MTKREAGMTTTAAAKSPRGAGPRRYTPALAGKICAMAASGATLDEIEAAFGVSRSSIHYWARADAAGLADYRGFRRKFYEARGAGYARKWGAVPSDAPPREAARDGG
jgi:hypothetical protein